MKKFLSIVISILMVSVMMSAVAFAEDATISLDAVTGLVAKEAVTLTPVVTGASEYTVEVNSQVFGITDGSAAAESIISKTVTAGQGFELTVNASVPQTFTSEIRLTAGTTTVKVEVSVADRLVGDVNGDGNITPADALQVFANYNNKDVAATFKYVAADANGDGSVTPADALQIFAKYNNKTVSNPAIGTAYIGGNAAIEIVDPFAAPATQQLGSVTDLYAYYQDGKLYYTFAPVANASGYTIKVGSADAVAIVATSGSVDASWDGEGTLAVEVVAKGDGEAYTDSEAASVNAVYAVVSDQLAQWLADNGLSDCAITVYEIVAE